MEQEPEPEIFTEEEYLEICSRSGEKYEYCNGLMWRKEDGPPGQDVEAPGTEAACSALAFNLAAHIGAQLRGAAFRGHAGALVLLPHYKGSFEARVDVAIVRGEALAASVGGPLEPVAILQIVRPSTSREEFGARYDGYHDSPGLRDIVWISGEFRSVQHRARQGSNSWLLGSHEQRSADEPDVRFELSGAPVSISLCEIYGQIALAPSPFSLSHLAPRRVRDLD